MQVNDVFNRFNRSHYIWVKLLNVLQHHWLEADLNAFIKKQEHFPNKKTVSSHLRKYDKNNWNPQSMTKNMKLNFLKLSRYIVLLLFTNYNLLPPRTCYVQWCLSALWASWSILVNPGEAGQLPCVNVWIRKAIPSHGAIPSSFSCK